MVCGGCPEKVCGGCMKGLLRLYRGCGKAVFRLCGMHSGGCGVAIWRVC